MKGQVRLVLIYDTGQFFFPERNTQEVTHTSYAQIVGDCHRVMER